MLTPMQTVPQPADSLAPSGAADGSAVYDTVWAGAEIPTAPPVGLETIMLQQEKLYVVLAVVLIIWLGLLFFLFRTDRRIARLEREVEARVPEHPDDTLR